MAMMIKQNCPECGGNDVVATGVGSSMFMCKSCGYVGGTHDTPQLGRELGVTEDEFEDGEDENLKSSAKLIGKSKVKSPKKIVRKKR